MGSRSRWIIEVTTLSSLGHHRNQSTPDLKLAMTDEARPGKGNYVEIDIPLDCDASVEDLMGALRDDPRAAGAHVAISATRDGHKAFSGEIPNIITIAIATAAVQVPATALALWIYDCLKRHAQGIRLRNMATTFSRRNLELAFGAALPIDLFVAFGRPVRNQARTIRDQVGRHGWWAFMDEDLPVGSVHAVELPQAISRARAIAYLLPTDLANLSYLMSEIYLGIKAREEFGTYLFPFVIPFGGGRLPDLPYGLNVFQAVAWDPDHPLDTAELLHQRLTQTLGTPSNQPPLAAGPPGVT